MVCLRDARTKTGLDGPFRHGNRRGLVDGIEVIEFDLHYSNYAGLLERAMVFFRYSWQSLLLVLRSDADLVFATTTPLTAGIPGIVARWLRGTPFVFEVRDLWPELPRAMGVLRNPFVLSALSALEWLSYHSADACIGLAPGICEGIAERGVLPSRITNIPNACDLDLFHPLPSGEIKQPEKIAGLSLDPGSLVVAFTGAHGICNGLDAVLDTASVLKYWGRLDIHFLFIGDGRCKPSLVQRVDDEVLTSCHFMPPIPKSELAGILAKSVHAGLMVLEDVPAFYRGTSPNKFFDYLSCGLPVINNYPGWLSEIIREEKVGLTVPPRSPEDFARALISIADDPPLRASLGSNARALAESSFSRELLSQRWCKVLEDTAFKYRARMIRFGFGVR